MPERVTHISCPSCDINRTVPHEEALGIAKKHDARCVSYAELEVY